MTVKLELTKLKYSYSALQPVLSKESVIFHYEVLSAAYVKKYHETLDPFQYAGAVLHNQFWDQLQAPSKSNTPTGRSLKLIEDTYSSVGNFKKEFEEKMLSIQGAGWCYLAIDGKIRVIHNHAVRPDIALLIDIWDHSYVIDYHIPDAKQKYLKNMWDIVNWDFVNSRIK